ncbi:glucose signaling factor 2-domain-containing protein [Lipomyces chichibuensis]|uniref:glucose signaling factor 2-domain-containing protein n=1 Tax=Lipomyces chichibuensis TaxID=1546026 RepID=UPI0033438CE3
MSDSPEVTEIPVRVKQTETATVTGEHPKKDKLIDIYVRLNGDIEKDYCFCLPRDSPIAVLHNIFVALPLVLSPTFFYHSKPAGFHLSTSPGFVTTEGALMFNHKGKLTPIDDTKRIGDVAREGQLFVPIFKHNLRRWFTVVFVLLFWLYTDLPDWASPTPGISIFAIATRIFEHFLPSDPDVAPEPQSTDGVVDFIFFLFHVIKVLVIFLIFFFGGYNPSSLNPFHEGPEVTPDNLRSIGWTGARRISPDEWREENRTRRIDEVGGAVKAYEKGILMGLSSAGIYLQPGEGWDTPWDFVPTATAETTETPSAKEEPEAILIEETETIIETETETLITSETTEIVAEDKDEKKSPADELDNIDIEAVLWRLGPDYEEKLTQYRRAEISRRMKLGDTVAVALKDWRRIGPLVAAPEVEKKYNLRKKLEARPDLHSKKLK